MKGMAIKALVGVAVALGLAVWAYRWGYGHAMDEARAAHVEAVHRAIEQYEEIQAQNRAVSRAWEEQLAEQEVVYRTIEREVTRYVEDQDDDPECLGPRGLRLWNAANAGRSPEPGAAGEPDGEVPGDAAGD